MQDTKLIDSVRDEHEKNPEMRVIAIGTKDLDAVKKVGIGVVIHDTHDFENIGLELEYRIKQGQEKQ